MHVTAHLHVHNDAPHKAQGCNSTCAATLPPPPPPPPPPVYVPMNNVPEVCISYIRCMEDNYMVALHFIWGGGGGGGGGSIIVFICLFLASLL